MLLSPNSLNHREWHCLSVQGKELALGCHCRALATPASVGDRRTHLEAAVQAGKAGGDSLTGLSFIWAEPDQLFLIKMHFAACSNVSMLIVYVCVHMCMWVCSETIQLCFLYRYSLNVAQNFKTCSEKWLCLIEAGFPGMAFCRETGDATLASQGTASGRVHKAYLLETWVHNSQFDSQEVPDMTFLFTGDWEHVPDVCCDRKAKA